MSNPTLANLYSFALSFMIGLLIGLERERSHPEGTKAIGVRTFILIALLGTLTSFINKDIITVVISLFTFSAILLGYFRSTEKRKKLPDIGITTEIAGGLVFFIGYIALSQPMNAVIYAGTLFLVLLGKRYLHKISRNRLEVNEVEAGIFLAIFGFGILPFLPNTAMDPWHIFNPQKFGLVVLIIAVMQFSSYALLQLFGQRLGVILIGLLGGLLSSTALFASLPHMLKTQPKLMRSIMAEGILATIGMLIGIAGVLFVAAHSLFVLMVLPLLTMMVVGCICALFLLVKPEKNKLNLVKPKNPLDIFSIIKFTALISILLILVSVAKNYDGNQGTMLISFLAGLLEIHSVTLATALLFLQNKLTLHDAGNVLAAAISATYVTKLFLLWTLTKRGFALRTSLLLLGMFICGGAIFVLTV